VHETQDCSPIDVPDHARVGLLDFLDRLGLRFAVCDLCVDHAGTWLLIEANPAGQWAWDRLRCAFSPWPPADSTCTPPRSR
jgi:hypothetical protein